MIPDVIGSFLKSDAAISMMNDLVQTKLAPLVADIRTDMSRRIIGEAPPSLGEELAKEGFEGMRTQDLARVWRACMRAAGNA